MSQKDKQIKLKKDLFSPKLDIVFQALFGDIGSERITKSLLESILNQRIDEIDLTRNPILRRQKPNTKLRRIIRYC